MKNTVKTLSVAICLMAFFASTALEAQEAEKREQNGERQTEILEKLDLSEDQKMKFTEIQKQYRADISELRSQGRNKGNRGKTQALTAQKDAEVKQILTEEQFERYKAFNKEIRNTRRRRL